MTFINVLKGYSVVLTKSTQKDLQKLPAAAILVIGKKLAQLTEEKHIGRF